MIKSLFLFLSFLIILPNSVWARPYHYQVARSEDVAEAASKLLNDSMPEIVKGLKVRQGEPLNIDLQNNSELDAYLTNLNGIAKIIGILPTGQSNNLSPEKTYEVRFTLSLNEEVTLNGSLFMDIVVTEYQGAEGSDLNNKKVLASLAAPACTGAFGRFPQIRVTDDNNKELFSKNRVCFSSKLPL